MKHTEEMRDVGAEYLPKDALTPEEIEDLSARASEQFCTMNGDAGTIEITVRQFALLLSETPMPIE